MPGTKGTYKAQPVNYNHMKALEENSKCYVCSLLAIKKTVRISIVLTDHKFHK